MTFDETMNRFFKNYSDGARQKAESSPFYQVAKKDQNSNEAQQIAIEIIEGLVKTPADGRKIRKEKLETTALLEYVEKMLE